MKDTKDMISSITAIEAALMHGDLSKLNENERLSYYKDVCESVGLNPLTQPFQYMTLNNKLVLYATRACAEQLRKINKISLRLPHKEKFGDMYVVTANAIDKDKREDESTGAVYLGSARGDVLANLLMKAETKAKRRVTLSISGLSFLDETEVETIPGAQKVAFAKNVNETIQIPEQIKAKPDEKERLNIRIEALLKGFLDFEVDRKILERVFEKSLEEFTEADFSSAIALGKAFRDGTKNKEDLLASLEIRDF
jgi:hypothetical protein